MNGAIPRSRLAAVLALAALVLPARALPDEPFQLVGVEQVEKMLGAADVKVLDVNVDELWEKHHLPGAVHVGSRALASLLPKDRGARLVFYCSGPK